MMIITLLKLIMILVTLWTPFIGLVVIDAIIRSHMK